jgi:Tfp pilus assembly protein FimV
MKINRGIQWLMALCLILSAQVFAESKRVHVYPMTQHYWDVQPGETMADIAAMLLPDSGMHRQKLINEIVRLNPDAFINGNPDRLQSNQRLWLPNTVTRPVSTRNSKIERFDWGYIKRAK